MPYFLFFLAVGESKLYYINIDFNNLASGNASVQYKEFEYDRERIVLYSAMYSIEIAAMLTERPMFTMIARNEANGNPFFLNGQTEWKVSGSEFKGERNLIDITDQGQFLLCATFPAEYKLTI